MDPYSDAGQPNEGLQGGELRSESRINGKAHKLSHLYAAALAKAMSQRHKSGDPRRSRTGNHPFYVTNLVINT